MSEWMRDALGLAEGETPFPWQEELLRQFISGKIPAALDIPTGLGKTSVMAIWLVARATGARLPRRLAYVVDRRAVVDQATEVAVGLREFVRMNPELSQKLGLDRTRLLPISTLRGQHVDNREWLEDPAATAIIVGTVDMIGSRLLFEGYGVSRKMRPYHAGLLGVDTLVVLDEAHLVPPFERLLQAIASDDGTLRPREPELEHFIPPFKLLSLSATGRSIGLNAFGLTPRDLEHAVVKKRLNAVKQLTVHHLTEGTKLAEELARQAWAISHEGKDAVRCIVYADKRDVAEKARCAVEKLAKGVSVDTQLFVGGRRVFEREDAKIWLNRRGFLGKHKVRPAQPAFVFATSAGEVGIDLDADHMVCDLVAWERMVQRLGRVNRRGEGNASVIVVLEPEPKGIDDLLGGSSGDRSHKESKIVQTVESQRAVKKVLQQLPMKDGALDASPGACQVLKERTFADPALRRALDAATTAAPLRPALSRGLMDAWSMTSLADHTGRPAIGPWLRGWIEHDPQTAVAWRVHLPVRHGDDRSSSKEVEAFFEVAPPHTSELLETETYRVAQWLRQRAQALLASAAPPSKEGVIAVKTALVGEDVVGFVLAPDNRVKKTLRWTDVALLNEKRAAKRAEGDLNRTLAGATLIIDARIGGLTKSGLLDAADNRVPPTLDGDNAWLEEGAVPFRIRTLAATDELSPERHWRERLRFPSDVSEEGEPRRWLIVEGRRHEADRPAVREQLLDEHQSWTEQRVRNTAIALGLQEFAEMLAAAACLHDQGKRARRWQRAFNAPRGGVFAKTKGPLDRALLDGYRHELASLAEAEDDERVRALSPEQGELALHLIAAHHGFARPVIGVNGCEDAPPSVLEDRVRRIALRFARMQDRWGPWGLAWWEALLRAADQQASRDNDEGSTAGGVT